MPAEVGHRSTISALIRGHPADRVYQCAARHMRQLRRTGNREMSRHYARIALDTADHADIEGRPDVLEMLSEAEEHQIDRSAEDTVRDTLKQSQEVITRYLEPTSAHDAEATIEELIGILDNDDVAEAMALKGWPNENTPAVRRTHRNRYWCVDEKYFWDETPVSKEEYVEASGNAPC
jgi:hypothetical protein